MRTCIMQKRVSFAFFKQWYWDCFDEDVQVCDHIEADSQRGMLSRQKSLHTKPHGASDVWKSDDAIKSHADAGARTHSWMPHKC